MRKIILSLLLIIINTIYAQVQYSGRPIGAQLKVARHQANTLIELPSFSQEEITNTSEIHHKSLKFAHPFSVNITSTNAGIWSTSPNGQEVWQVSFHSKGAASLNVIFSRFRLPEGGKVFIYNKDMSHVIGAFTHLNNKKSGVLPTLPIQGDYITVEYQAPKNPDFEAELSIGTINHDYLGFYNKLGKFGDAASCEKDASCYTDDIYQSSIRSTVKLIIDGNELMTGTLVNNTLKDATPYVLTAAHGYEEHNMDAASTLFVFNYQVPYCFATVEGTREQSVAGGEMLCYSPNINNSGLDFALLKMSIKPPMAYLPAYAGWSLSTDLPSQTHCVHHPQGDVKKISFDDNSVVISSMSTSDHSYLNNGHWRVLTWEEGVTEGGSSGSGIFNNKNQFLGGLSGGAADCNHPRDDFFYRIDLAWEAPTNTDSTLSQWLDSNQTGVRELDAYIPDDIQQTKRTSHINALSEISSVKSEEYGNIAGNNQLGITRFVEKFESHDSTCIIGFYFVPSEGTSMSYANINIWSGNSTPDSLLYSSPLIIKRWSNSFPNSQDGHSGGYYLKENLALNENFVMLPQGICTDKNIFIGFEVNNTQQEAPFGLSLCNTNSNNNAYYYDGYWHLYSQLENYNKATSLWIEPILYSHGSKTSLHYQQKKKVLLWPNPVNDSHELHVNTCLSSSISIYTIEGKRCICPMRSDLNTSTIIDTRTLEQGTYLLKTGKQVEIFIKH